MAIFNKLDKDSAHPGKSIIADGCTIRGELELSGDCHIDGCVEGNIFSKQNISIGQSGSINGFVMAKHIIINGKFEGQVDCVFLEVRASGEVHGDIKADRLNFETGSKFTGYSHQDNSKQFYSLLPEHVKSHLEKQLAIDVDAISTETLSKPIVAESPKLEKNQKS